MHGTDAIALALAVAASSLRGLVGVKLGHLRVVAPDFRNRAEETVLVLYACASLWLRRLRKAGLFLLFLRRQLALSVAGLVLGVLSAGGQFLRVILCVAVYGLVEAALVGVRVVFIGGVILDAHSVLLLDLVQVIVQSLVRKLKGVLELGLCRVGLICRTLNQNPRRLVFGHSLVGRLLKEWRLLAVCSKVLDLALNVLDFVQYLQLLLLDVYLLILAGNKLQRGIRYLLRVIVHHLRLVGLLSLRQLRRGLPVVFHQLRPLLPLQQLSRGQLLLVGGVLRVFPLLQALRAEEERGLAGRGKDIVINAVQDLHLL